MEESGRRYPLRNTPQRIRRRAGEKQAGVQGLEQLQIQHLNQSYNQDSHKALTEQRLVATAGTFAIQERDGVKKEDVIKKANGKSRPTARPLRTPTLSRSYRKRRGQHNDSPKERKERNTSDTRKIHCKPSVPSGSSAAVVTPGSGTGIAFTTGEDETKTGRRILTRSRYHAIPAEVVIHEEPDPNEEEMSPPKIKTIRCLLDEDPGGYAKLANHYPWDTMEIPLTKSYETGVGHNEFTDGIARMFHPGIRVRSQDGFKSCNLFTLSLGPKTCTQIAEASSNAVFVVLDGSVWLKTSGFHFAANWTPYLGRKLCNTGSNFTIPNGCMYSLENWGEEEVKLVTVMVP